jgi:hypothetical protein
VKFANRTRVAARDAVRDKHRRGRTAAPVFRNRYPELGSLQLDFDFSDRTELLPSPQVTVFHPPAHAYFCFACPYSDCDGEFDLTSPVDLLVSSHEHQASGQIRCPGTRHRGIACTLCLEYSITAHWA